jgi:hypothetical protein
LGYPHGGEKLHLSGYLPVIMVIPFVVMIKIWFSEFDSGEEEGISFYQRSQRFQLERRRLRAQLGENGVVAPDCVKSIEKVLEI